MTDRELFNKTEEIIVAIISAIDDISTNFSNKSPYQKQQLNDIKMGLVRTRSSLYVPLTSVSHRILFEEYSLVFIKSFLSFYKNLFSNINNVFIEFSFRTLIESGIEIAQILFSNEIEKEERGEFILSLILIDYAILAPRHPSFLRDLKNLFKEESGLLNEKEKDIFNEILESIESEDKNRLDKAVEKALRENNVLQKKLLLKTKTADFLNIKKIYYLYSWYSHLLHGNVFLTNNLFEETDNPYQHKLRSHYILLFTGCSFLYQVQNQVTKEDTKSKINQIIEDFKNIEPDIKNFWGKYLKLM